jgi:hypothetical protein
VAVRVQEEPCGHQGTRGHVGMAVRDREAPGGVQDRLRSAATEPCQDVRPCEGIDDDGTGS